MEYNGPVRAGESLMVVGFMIGRVAPVTSLGALVTDLHLSFRQEFRDSRDAVKLVVSYSPDRLQLSREKVSFPT